MATNTAWSESASRPATDYGLLVTGVTLLGIGGVIGLTGLALGGVALVRAARHRLNNAEVPPSEIARRTLAQARAATVAGAGAWREARRQPVAR